MKQRLYILFILIMALASACKKDSSHVFDESPDARLNRTLAAYQAQLTGAANGWKGVILLAGGGVNSFYCKFNDSNRVKMVMDFDSTSAVTLKESSYRLKALQQPSLIFDTYTYLHLLADPTDSINGGASGSGLLSDFEFYFDSTHTDTVKLVGRMNGSNAFLVKASAAEAAAYTTGKFNINLFKNAYGKILEYFKRLTIGTRQYELILDLNTKTIVFNWLDGSGNLQTFSSKFYLTLSGISLLTPFNTGTLVITEMTNVNFVASTSTLEVTINGTVYKIQGAIAPLKNDINAPQAWWNKALNNGNVYWVTETNFHINGVDDALKVANITGYAGFSIYWPQFGTSGFTKYDLLSPITAVGAAAPNINFGAAYRPPNFTTDGKVIFSLLGTLGTAPTGTSTTIFTNYRNKFAEASGYYLILRPNGIDYDMVNVADARAWITWEWVF